MAQIKIGDVVTCGRAGWWRVKSFDLNRKDRLILEMVMDNKGQIPKRSRAFSAAINWCKKTSVQDIQEQKERDRKRWDTLLFILDPSLISEELINKEVIPPKKPEPDYLQRLHPPLSLIKK